MPPSCGFHFGEQQFAALSLKPGKRGWTVLGCAVAYIPETHRDDLGWGLRALGKGMRIKTGAGASVSISKLLGITRTVTLPSAEPAELKQMARFEAERHIPLHADRHVTNYHVMRRMGDSSEVVLGSVDGPVVQKVVDALLGSTLSPAGIGLSSLSLVNAALHHEGREELAAAPTAVVNFGLDQTDIVLLHEARIVYARAVRNNLRRVLERQAGFRPEDPDDARPSTERLASLTKSIDLMEEVRNDPEHAQHLARCLAKLLRELGATWDYARRELECPKLERILVTGEAAVMQNFAEWLQRETELPVAVFNPVAKLPGMKKQNAPFEGHEYSLCFGSVLATGATGGTRRTFSLDLTPQDYYHRIAHKRLMRRLAVSAVVLAATLGLGFHTFQQYSILQRQRMQAYNEINKRMEPMVAELDEMQTKLKIIRSFIEDPNSGLNVLSSVASSPLIPQRITINGIEYERKDTLVIEGDAQTIPDVTAFEKELINSGHFSEVLTMKMDPGSLYGRELYRFKFECPLSVKEPAA